MPNQPLKLNRSFVNARSRIGLPTKVKLSDGLLRSEPTEPCAQGPSDRNAETSALHCLDPDQRRRSGLHRRSCPHAGGGNRFLCRHRHRASAVHRHGNRGARAGSGCRQWCSASPASPHHEPRKRGSGAACHPACPKRASHIGRQSDRDCGTDRDSIGLLHRDRGCAERDLESAAS